MNQFELFKAVKAEFSEEVAISAVVVNAINLSIGIKNSDLLEKGRFTKRIIKKAKKVLWRLSDAEFEEAFTIAMVYHEYDMRKTMRGLGGCTEISFRDLLEKRNMDGSVKS